MAFSEDPGHAGRAHQPTAGAPAACFLTADRERVFSHPLPCLPAAQHRVPERCWRLRLLLLLTRDCLQAPAHCQFTGKGHAVHDQHLSLQHTGSGHKPLSDTVC